MKCTLITTGYNEPNKHRMAEYLLCLRRNMDSKLFRNIVVVVEGDPKVFKAIPIQVVQVGWRQTYCDMFEVANKLDDDVTVVANGDIYFDNTLNKLQTVDLTDKFLAISRRDRRQDGKLTEPHNPKRSQDAWIFKPPLKKFMCDIPIAKPGCDQRVSWEAKNAGLKVLNPCFSINAIHLHESKYRTYSWNRDRLHGPYLELPPCAL